MNIRRPLINHPDLAVPPEFLRGTIPHKTHPAHPLDGLPADLARDLAREQLRHGCVRHESHAGLLLPRRIIHQPPRGHDLRVRLGQLVLHALELADQLPELSPIVPDVRRRVLPGTQRQTRHLRRDADAAFVQETNGVLVPLPLLAQQLVPRDLDVVEGEDHRATRPNAQFLLLLRHVEPGGALLHDKGRDALVPLFRVQVREDDIQTGLGAVRDPHLRPVDPVAVCRFHGLGLQREGVAPARRLTQTEGSECPRGQGGEPLPPTLARPVLQDSRVDERVVHIHHDTHAGVHARQLLDRHDRRREIHARPAVLLGDLDPHQPRLEALFDDRRVHRLTFVHGAHVRLDGGGGKFADRVGHQGFRLGEVGDGRWGDGGDVLGGGGVVRREVGEGANAAVDGQSWVRVLGEQGVFYRPLYRSLVEQRSSGRA